MIECLFMTQMKDNNVPNILMKKYLCLFYDDVIKGYVLCIAKSNKIEYFLA